MQSRTAQNLGLAFPIPSLNPTVINRKLVCSINIRDNDVFNILNSEESLF